MVKLSHFSQIEVFVIIVGVGKEPKKLSITERSPHSHVYNWISHPRPRKGQASLNDKMEDYCLRI